MYSKILICLCFTLFSSGLFSQRYKEKTPLHHFFQTNYDSTVIYFEWSSWNISPNYFIIAKKDSNVYYFTYTSPYRNMIGYKHPGLINKFLNEELLFSKTTPDTNRYLLPYKVDYPLIKIHWQKINNNNLWNLTDNIAESKKCESYDAGWDTYYLITKTYIKILSFYDSEYFEECDSKNINRQNQIKTKQIIKKVFKSS